MEITPTWFQKVYFWEINDKLRYFSVQKLKFLSETCKTGSITVQKYDWRGIKIGIFWTKIKPVCTRTTTTTKTRTMDLPLGILESSLLFTNALRIHSYPFKFFQKKHLNQIFRYRTTLSLSLSLSGFIGAAEGSVDDSVVRLYISL